MLRSAAVHIFTTESEHDSRDTQNRIRLMQAMDHFNQRFGRSSVMLGSARTAGRHDLSDEAGATVVGIYDGLGGLGGGWMR